MIVAIAITGFIGIGAAAATAQVFSQTTRNTDYTAASRQALNAIHWISRDAQMAQDIEPNGASGFPLTLAWTEWDSSDHQVTYSLSDDRLERSYSTDGGAPVETLVAEYINTTTEMTSCSFTSGVMTLKITASVGEGVNTINVTKVREISPRPCS
jgi:hypothetical protein